MLKKKLIAIGIVVIFILSSFNTTVMAAGLHEPVQVAKASACLLNPVFPYNGVNYKFFDSKNVEWAFNSIEKMALKGILNGVGQGMFAPRNNVTQLEALTMVLRLAGDEKEVEKNKGKKHNSYKGYIPEWGLGYAFVAIKNGILLPEELDNFNFTAPAKRHEIAKYIIRALGKTDEALKYMNKELPFKDSSAIPKKSIGYVYLANKLEIMIGDNNNKFNPMQPVTRAEMAVLLDRAEGNFDLPDTDNRKNNTIFVEANTSKNRITVKTNGVSHTYNVLSGAQIYRNGSFGTIKNLVEGDILQLILNNDQEVIFVEVLKSSIDDSDEEETDVSFNKVSGGNLPDVIKTEVEKLKSSENYKAYEYDNYIYLIAFMGRQKTGGYSITIEDVTRVKKNNNYTIMAEVYSEKPSKGSSVTQAITYPYAAVKFKSFDKIKSVVFTDTDGDKIKEVNIEKPVKVTSVKGVIYELVSSCKTIKIEKSDGSKASYTVPSSAEIKVNGRKNSGFSNLKIDMDVELELKDNVVTKVIADTKEEEDISFKAIEYNSLPSPLKDHVDSLKLTQNYKAYEYDGYVYLIASMGKQKTKGYTMSIESVIRTEKSGNYTIKAEVYSDKPSPGYYPTQTTYPYSVVRFKSFNNIKNVIFTDTDGNKIKEVNIEKPIVTSVVKGVIYELVPGSKTVKIEKQDGSKISFAVPSSAKITVNDYEGSSFSDLKKGMNIELEIKDNIVIKISAKGKTTDSISFNTIEYDNLATPLKTRVDNLKLAKNYKAFEYNDNIYLIAALGKKTASGYEVNFEALDKTEDGGKFIVRAEISVFTPFPSVGMKTQYPYSIIKFSKFKDISKVTFVDTNGSKIADSDIVKLVDSYEISGTIKTINDSKKTIGVEDSDGSTTTLSIPGDAKITVNNSDKEFKDLKVGMTVKIEMVDNIATKVEAGDKNLELTGKLEGITIAEEKLITVKIDGENRTYTVGSSITIIIDSEDGKNVEDLIVGDMLVLSFSNGTLIQIVK